MAGLPQDCVVVCHQITTLDRSKLQQQIGFLPESEMRAIEAAILNAIDVTHESSRGLCHSPPQILKRSLSSKVKAVAVVFGLLTEPLREFRAQCLTTALDHALRIGKATHSVTEVTSVSLLSSMSS